MEMVKTTFWRVRGAIEIGKRFTMQNRDYVLLKTEPYTTKLGHASMLLNWEGRCVVCNNKFRFKAARSWFEPTATCKKHRGQA